ncbi:MAG: hypothetical protein AAF399_23950 [Bacteroidota bacterium]
MPESDSSSFFLPSQISRLLPISILLLLPWLAWGQSSQAFSSLLFSCYEVQAYQLEVQFNSKTQRIAGSNQFQLEMIHPSQELQFDLAAPLQVHRIEWEGKGARFEQTGDIVTVQFARAIPAGRTGALRITFGGELLPQTGSTSPWQDDGSGLPLLLLNERTIAGKQWWPCKQSLPDQADSLTLTVIADLGEEVHTSGTFRQREYLPGQFVKWHHSIPGPLLPQSLDLYVGQLNIDTATYQNAAGAFQLRYMQPYGFREDGPGHLAEMISHIRCLEAFWGPFPFVGGGLDWVASGTSQSLPLRAQLSSAWWGGAVQAYQEEDEWLIESLQEYAEALIIECQEGSEESLRFLREEASEGTLLLHSLRRLTDNDETWFAACRELAQTYQQQALSTAELTDFLDWKLGLGVSTWVDHLRRESGVPTLEYYVEKKRKKRVLFYRWATSNPAFDMPIDVYLSSDKMRLFPTMDWRSFPLKQVKEKELAFDPDSGWVQYESTTP